MENSHYTYVQLSVSTPGIHLSLLTWYPSKTTVLEIHKYRENIM